MANKDTHCSYCGSPFSEEQQLVWPRKCNACNNESYRNPIPIVVALVPVLSIATRWLIEQRNIEPEKGGWALPSGYVDFNESWQDAVVRELQEEVGLTTQRDDWCLYKIVKSATGNMLIFCAHSGVFPDEIKFTPNHEVSAIEFPAAPEDKHLCFPSHNEVWAQYYGYNDRC